MSRNFLRFLPILLVSVSACSKCGSENAAPAPTSAATTAATSAATTATAAAPTPTAAAPAPIPADAAAIVNGRSVITKAQIDAEIHDLVSRYESAPSRPPTTPEWRNERRRRLVQDAVWNALIADHVAKQNVSVTDEEVTNFLKVALPNVFENERLYERYLSTQQKTREQHLADTRAELLTDKVLALGGALEPGEEEIAAFYNENRDRWREDERVKVLAITVRVQAGATPAQEEAALAKITEFYNQAKAGSDFAELAAKGDGPEAIRAGDMGWVIRGRRRQLEEHGVEDLLFRADVGKVTEPKRTALGYQIFLVQDHRPAGPRALDELRDVLREPIRRRNREKLRAELANRLVAGAEITYREDQMGIEPPSADGSGAPVAAPANKPE